MCVPPCMHELSFWTCNQSTALQTAEADVELQMAALLYSIILYAGVLAQLLSICHNTQANVV
jgi:hypothetical protein